MFIIRDLHHDKSKIVRVRRDIPKSRTSKSIYAPGSSETTVATDPQPRTVIIIPNTTTAALDASRGDRNSPGRDMRDARRRRRTGQTRRRCIIFVPNDGLVNYPYGVAFARSRNLISEHLNNKTTIACILQYTYIDIRAPLCCPVTSPSLSHLSANFARVIVSSKIYVTTASHVD